MNKKLLKIELIGYFAVSAAGTICHFIYEWSGESTIAALFCPVNESPWEHLKLLFFPFFVFTIIQNHLMKNDKFNVFSSNYIGIVTAMATTLAIYYTALGITGESISFFNIFSFFAGLFAAFFVSYLMINSSIGARGANIICCAMFFVSAIIFVLFTFEPPIIPLFRDPQSLKYGI